MKKVSGYTAPLKCDYNFSSIAATFHNLQSYDGNSAKSAIM